MEPPTTLFTFLLQTEPGVQSVQLVGSWDNFSNHYTMQRDIRRGRDQWKGCYSFKDGACHNHAVGSYNKKKTPGLTMGNTYYYYYELDGSIETHDSKLPSTTACPYLPGQTVNTITIPTEKTPRFRSASLNSMRMENYQTMDPGSKFVTPRPAPRIPLEVPIKRVDSPPARLRNKASSRSLSPAPVWKRIFSRKASSRDLGCHSSIEQEEQEEEEPVFIVNPPALEELREPRAITPPSEGTRTRDISPESLRRFLLSKDLPSRPGSAVADRPTLVIPDDNFEENDDDDNFATSAVSEYEPFATCLSPPPYKRSTSAASNPFPMDNSSSRTLTIARPSSQPHLRRSNVRGNIEMGGPSSLPKLKTSQLQPHGILSAPTSAIITPLSPYAPSDDLTSFYDSNDDEDDAFYGRQTSANPSKEPHVFEGYSLPRHIDEKATDARPSMTSIPSSKQLAQDANLSASHANYLDTTINTESFASELGWVAEAISHKHS